MDNAISLALKKGAEFAEVINSSTTRNIIEAVNKDIKELSSGSRELSSIRVLFEGKWGLAYSYKKDFRPLVLEAINNAKSSDFSINLSFQKPVKRKFTTAFKKNPDDYSMEEKKNNLLKHYSKNKNISSLRLIYSESKSNTSYLNSEGSKLEWNDISSGIMCWSFAKKNNKMENFVEIERIKGGYEIMDKAEYCISSAIKKSIMLLDAKKPKGRAATTIIDQKLGGVLAHEAIGHACEADLVLGNSSLLQGKLNNQIGNELVSITDNGLLKKWGYMPFDSEGTIARRNVLVKNGILKGYLHNRETASLMGSNPTGNGRSMNPSCKVIVRMTNTYFENGKSKFHDALKEVKDGYYLKGSAGGQVDPSSGEFLFNASEGYEVKNGEIGKMLKGASLTGNIKDTLHKIRMVCNDLEFGTGYCGKSGQHVPVGDGAPHILIDGARVGGM